MCTARQLLWYDDKLNNKSQTSKTNRMKNRETKQDEDHKRLASQDNPEIHKITEHTLLLYF